MVQRTCALLDCEQAHYGKGYCRPHYKRLKRYGDPLGWKHQQTDTCEVQDCDTKPWARNLCGTHYQRWRKHGDPRAHHSRKPRTCSVGECDGPAHGHGWCVRHYRLWRIYDNPEWQPPRYDACIVDWCSKVPRSALASLCEAHYMRLRRNGTLDEGQCSVCQEPLPRNSTLHRRYCATCCLDRRRARSRDQDHRRRAFMRMGESERIDSLEIYERDGWRCGLCYERVDPQLAWPHPQSPSLDHIIPLARGGNHVRTNVQLAHLTCNLSKGARGGGEQLMFIG